MNKNEGLSTIERAKKIAKAAKDKLRISQERVDEFEKMLLKLGGEE